MTKKDLLSEEFSTNVSLEKATFDEENLVIRGASLTFHKSRNGNGRHYLPEAMEDLRNKSEGSFVYADKHIKKAGDRHVDLSEVGIVKNVSGDAKRNRGDLHLFKTDKARTFFEVCRAKPESYALSHEAMQCEVTGRSPLKVKGVSDVAGYILTSRPGTNTSLFESIEDEDMPLTVKKLREEHPEIVEELLAEEAATLEPADTKESESDSEIAQKLIDATIELEKVKEERDALKKEKGDREAAEKAKEELVALKESMESIAKEEKRVLSEEMFDVFVLAKKDELADLTEDHKRGFIKQLPILSEGPDEEDPKPTEPGSRSGTSTATKTKRRLSSSLVNLYTRRK